MLAIACWLCLAACADERPESDLYLPATLLRVVDGDTIKVRLGSGPIMVRLHGIDTPESGESLGKAATKALRSRVEGEPLEIEPIEQNDGFGRMVAKVFIRGDDVNARMVESGYAWAYRRYLRHEPVDENYCRLEAEARAAGRGVWVGAPDTWQPPWELRARGHDGAASGINWAEETAERCIAGIGRKAPAPARPQSAADPAPDPACRIKGNINARGERIYHEPGANSYAATRIDTERGERWFCSVDEAERAGWRAPRQ